MKKNIIANFIGRFWGVFSNFIFVPIYISLLGLENFSIISFSLVITGLMSIMDAGISSTLSREFASSTNSKKDRKDIFNTLETTYIIIAVFIIIIMFFGANSIAFNWLNLSSASPKDVSILLKIIGFEIGFKFISQFYSSGFIGLEKQVKANIYQVIWGVFRNGLVVIPIIFYPSLEVFFIWQTITTVIYAIFMRFDLIKTLNSGVSNFFNKLEIKKVIIKRVWRFAGGMMLISIVAALNTQMDKIFLSKLLSIEVLGLYTLAFSLARGINIIVRPISIAVLPRITNYVTSNKENEFKELFKKAYILISILIFSFAASLIVFAKEIIFIWTNDMLLAENSYIYMLWIVIGTSFIALQGMPFNIAIANKYTKYNNIIGITSLIITMPGYWFLTNIYGGVGAAMAFSFVQVVSAIIYLFLINKKFIKLSIIKLYFNNILLPLVVSILIAFLFKEIVGKSENRFLGLIFIGLSVTLSLIVNSVILIPINVIKKEIFNLTKKKK